jgi:hypothetical protein
MTELLSSALKAHGGLERWNNVKAIKVAASIYWRDLVRQRQARLSQERGTDR